MGGPAVPRGPVLPALPKALPTVQLKGFYWSKISNNQVSNTIWIKENIAKNTNTVDLDVLEIESTFAAKKASVAEEGGAAAESSSASAAPVLNPLIDPKKSNNGAIVFTQMRMEVDDLKKAIISVDEKKLTAQQIKSLREYCPTQEEVCFP